jgi:hypothetical protein
MMASTSDTAIPGPTSSPLAKLFSVAAQSIQLPCPAVPSSKFPVLPGLFFGPQKGYSHTEALFYASDQTACGKCRAFLSCFSCPRTTAHITPMLPVLNRAYSASFDRMIAKPFTLCRLLPIRFCRDLSLSN